MELHPYKETGKALGGKERAKERGNESFSSVVSESSSFQSVFSFYRIKFFYAAQKIREKYFQSSEASDSVRATSFVVQFLSRIL